MSWKNLKETNQTWRSIPRIQLITVNMNQHNLMSFTAVVQLKIIEKPVSFESFSNRILNIRELWLRILNDIFYSLVEQSLTFIYFKVSNVSFNKIVYIFYFNLIYIFFFIKKLNKMFGSKLYIFIRMCAKMWVQSNVNIYDLVTWKVTFMQCNDLNFSNSWPLPRLNCSG